METSDPERTVSQIASAAPNRPHWRQALRRGRPQRARLPRARLPRALADWGRALGLRVDWHMLAGDPVRRLVPRPVTLRRSDQKHLDAEGALDMGQLCCTSLVIQPSDRRPRAGSSSVLTQRS